HDDAAHAKLRPSQADARATFDAVEEMRIQALGANAMKGVANNLTASLTDLLERKGAARMKDANTAPVAEALALMVRERLTGLKPPPNATALVEVWRKRIEDGAGPVLNKMEAVSGDQRAFAKLLREAMTDLGIGDEL